MITRTTATTGTRNALSKAIDLEIFKEKDDTALYRFLVPVVPVVPVVTSFYGQFGVCIAPGVNLRQSARTGAKTSMTTAPSAPAIASCGTLAGMTYVSPT